MKNIMNKNKHIFINYRLLLTLILLFFVLLFAIALSYYAPSSKALDIFVIIFIAFLIIGLFFMEPHYCIITSAKVQIIYAFGLKECAEWKDIRKIYRTTRKTGKWSYADAYNFVGIKGKKAFFMDGEFYKSKRMTKLLEQYAKNKLEK